MLRIDSALQDEGNDLRKVLDRTVGEYMDASEAVFDQLFLTSATGGWLDCFGQDFGVPRRLDEDDESYRERIIFEKLEYLTVGNLQSIYGLDLYAFVSGFNPHENQLTSDNPYIHDRYMSIADESMRNILNDKFVLDSAIVWLDESSFINPNRIINIYGEDVLEKYISVLSEVNLENYFKWNREIKEIVLILDKALTCKRMFYGSELTSLDLELANATDCKELLMYCDGLLTLNLDLPNATECTQMLQRCSSLETVNLNLPKATNCDSMMLYCSSLTSLDLDLPNAIDCTEMMSNCTSLITLNLDLANATTCNYMLLNCSSLESVTLNLPNLVEYGDIFFNCSNLETIDVTIPTSIINDFKNYVLGLNLQHLTSFKINGDEQL